MKKRVILFFIVLFIFVPLFFFRGGFEKGKVFNSYDLYTLDAAFRTFAQDQMLHHGSFPLWMPYIFAGMPAIDSASVPFLYPSNLITTLLGIPAAMTFNYDMIFHMLLAAAGMFLFLRKAVSEKYGAVFGALVFMCSGIMVSYVSAGHFCNIEAATYFPWIFYFLYRGTTEKKLLWFAGAGLCIGMQVAVMGMQVMTYNMMAAAAYTAWLALREKGGVKGILFPAGGLVFALLACFIFSSPQLVPLMQYVKETWRWGRGYEYFISWSFPPAETITFILPQFFGLTGDTYWGTSGFNANTFYMGIIPLLLLPAAFAAKSRRGPALFFIVTAAVFLLLSYGGFTPLAKLTYKIPIINGFRTANRYLYVFTLCITAVAAIGLSNIFNMEKKEEKALLKTVKISASCFLSAAVIILIMSHTSFMLNAVSGIFRQIKGFELGRPGLDYIMSMIKQDAAAFLAIAAVFYGAIMFYLRRGEKYAAAILAVICVVHAADIYRIEKQYITYVDEKQITAKMEKAFEYLRGDKDIFRVMEPGGSFFRNINIFYGIEFLTGYHAFTQGKVLKMIEAGDFNKPSVARALNVKYYILAKGPAVQSSGGGYSDGDFTIQRDPLCKPRFYVADEVIKLSGDAEAYSYFTSQAFNPGQAVVTAADAPLFAPQKASYRVRVSEYTPSRIKLTVDSENDGMLVISNYFYHRWKAFIDKNPVKIYNVNYLVSGVAVKKGKNEVLLYYDGSYLWPWVLLAAAAFAGLTAWIIYELRRKSGTKGKGKKGK